MEREDWWPWPTCVDTSVGYRNRTSYRDDGIPKEDGTLPDCTFAFSLDSTTTPVRTYGLFHGFNGGPWVAKCANKRMVTEITINEQYSVDEKIGEEDVIRLLEESYLNVDRHVNRELEEMLTKKWKAMEDGQRETVRKIEEEIKGASTAMVILRIGSKLYVANCGNSRAVLVTHQDNNYTATLLNQVHEPENNLERFRLEQLGVNPDDIEAPTRCFGDAPRRINYAENPKLAKASEEPIIADPSIRRPVELDESARFLLLASIGVIDTLVETAAGSHESNFNPISQLTMLTLKELKHDSDFASVAQAVLDGIARAHKNAFQTQTLPRKVRLREDMTLMVIRLSSRSSAAAAAELAAQLEGLRFNEQDEQDEQAEQLQLDKDGKLAAYVSFDYQIGRREAKPVVEELEKLIALQASQFSVPEDDESQA